MLSIFFPSLLRTKICFLIIFFISFSSFQISLCQIPQISYTAFKPGEELKYNIHYGFINAGSIQLKINKELKKITDQYLYSFYAHGRSNKGWDLFYKVRDYYQSYVDTATLLPVYASRNILEGNYQSSEFIIFKRDDNIVISNGQKYHVPNKIFDLLSAFYYARCLDAETIKFNKEIPFNTFFEKELFPVGVTITGRSVIETKLGKFKCLIVRPKLIEGRIFKDQSDMTIYVSDDKNNIPIRIQTAIFIGYIKADLIYYDNLKYPLTSKIE